MNAATTPHDQKPYAVLTRMAELRNASVTCGLKDCRRARGCVGTQRKGVWRLPEQAFKLPLDDVAEWRALVRQRTQCLSEIRAGASLRK